MFAVMRDPDLYKKRRKLDDRYYLLKEWYGGAASTEMAAHCPEAVNVGKLAEEVLKKSCGPDLAMRMDIEKNWTRLAGSNVAAMTRINSYNGGILLVEVKHPLYLREVAMTSDVICGNINAVLGANCQAVKFIPSTGRKK